MILPRLGQWSSAHGRWLTWWRFYYHGHWTPLCRVEVRYLRDAQGKGWP